MNNTNDKSKSARYRVLMDSIRLGIAEVDSFDEKVLVLRQKFRTSIYVEKDGRIWSEYCKFIVYSAYDKTAYLEKSRVIEKLEYLSRDSSKWEKPTDEYKLFLEKAILQQTHPPLPDVY